MDVSHQFAAATRRAGMPCSSIELGVIRVERMCPVPGAFHRISRLLAFDALPGVLLFDPIRFSCLSDGKMTTICILPSEGRNSFQSLMKSTSDVRAFFAKWYPRLFADAEISEEVARDFLEKRWVAWTLAPRSVVHRSVSHVRDHLA